MDRIAAILVDRRKPILALTMLITLTAAACLFRFDFNADVTSFLADGNERGREFVAVSEKYDAGEPITVLLERDAGWGDREGLEALIAIRDAYAAVEGVDAVGSLVPDEHPLTGEPFDAAALAAIPDMMLGRLLDNPAAPMMLSEDRRATMLVILPEGSGVDVVPRLLEVDLPSDVEADIAGNPVVFSSVLGMLGWVLLVIPPVVIVLLLAVFTANVGSPKLALLSIVPAILGSVWTFGLVFGLGLQVDLVTVIVPIFVIVMGSADGLHFVTHLQDSRDEPDPRARTARTLREVGVPMILTTISTAAGFLSLLATDVGPIRQLGVFVAIGITFAGVVSFFFLPALLSGIEIPPKPARSVGGRLTAGLQWAAGRPIIAGVVALVLLAFAGATLPKLDVNTDQLFFFKQDHEVRQSFRKLEQAFGAATPLVGELAYDPDDPDLDAARERLDELRALPGIKRVFSVVDVADALPPDARAALLSGETSPPMGRMVSEDGMRFVVFPGEFDGDDLQAWLDWADAHEDVRTLTGMPVLFDEMSRLVMRAQASSLAMAFGLVFIMLLVAYRRIGAALLSMLPLVVTTAVLLGFLAISGIQLHLLTAVISSIVIGVGIDYAIHLMAAIEHARENPDIEDPVAAGLDAAGRPIIANALGVAAGMSALFISPLLPHNQIAVIMWVSMLTAATTALLFIPALTRKRRPEAEA